MTEPINEGSVHASSAAPSIDTNKVSISRVIISGVLMVVWAIIYFNIFHLSAPAFSLLSLLIGIFAPSFAAGILLKRWAFGNRGSSTARTRGFRIATFFLIITLLPVAAFMGQVLMIVAKY